MTSLNQLDMEAVYINIKSTLTVLSLLALVLFVSVNAVSAATTVDQTSILKSADTIKKQVETKKTLPSSVTVAKKKLTKTQYLDVLATTVTNANKKSKSSVAVKTVANAPSPSESLKSGSFTKKQYLDINSRVSNFIKTNKRAPNFVTTPLGKMRYENLIYTYSKILVYYKVNKKLPSSVSVKTWYTLTGKSSTFNVPEGSYKSKIDTIGRQEAKYADIQGQSSPTVMEKVGYGDCWASAHWLFNKLKAAKIPVRVMQTSSGGILYLHQWVEINTGSGWKTWDYNKYNSQHYGRLGSGIFVVKTAS